MLEGRFWFMEGGLVYANVCILFFMCGIVGVFFFCNCLCMVLSTFC